MTNNPGKVLQLKDIKEPVDQFAEQALLSCILRDQQHLAEVSGTITEESFYSAKHQAIYKAMLDLYETSVAIDEVTLGNRLNELDLLETAGGFYYIADLVNVAPLNASVAEYAKIVQNYYYMREIMLITKEIARKSADPAENLEAILGELEQKISTVYGLRQGAKTFHLSDVMSSVVTLLEERGKSLDHLIGLETGFIDLDDITLGLQDSDLIVVAARPSMGKTSFALNIACHVALKEKHPVHFFSLEMSKEQLAMRILGSEAQIDSKTLRSGKLTKDEWPKFFATVDKMSKAPLYISDISGLNIIELLSIAKTHANHIAPKLLVVDYLQLLSSAHRTNNREQEIAEISRSLKALAKTLNIPVIAVSQLNRAPEARANKRPMMSDIRESGAVEQDADIIMFLYRDEVYNAQSADKGKAEIIIAKHRNGQIGTKKLAFIGEYTKFANLSQEEQAPSKAPYEPV